MVNALACRPTAALILKQYLYCSNNDDTCAAMLLSSKHYSVSMTTVSDAYENARFLCEQYYMTAPECNFICLNRKFSHFQISVQFRL